MRNPVWTRDELILALELYFRAPAARGSKSHPEVIALSGLLNQLPIHPNVAQGETFRNPSGVGMKLSNFLAFDPDYEGKGLARGNKLEDEVWREYALDRPRLERVAEAIRENYQVLGSATLGPDDITSEEDEAAEGQVLTRVHKYRERNTKIVKKKKKTVLEKTGHLICEACGFDFHEIYGEIGHGFAECHHDKPVSELKPGEKTKLSDLRIVCANCHRMIHRSKPWKNVREIASLVTQS